MTALGWFEWGCWALLMAWAFWPRKAVDRQVPGRGAGHVG